MNYPLAERFKAPQGEGLYTGTPMAFLRFTGCSVGHRVCTLCDTQFDKMDAALGGGLYTGLELVQWVGDYRHICLTGGEPLDRDLSELLFLFADCGKVCHIETSGTVAPKWLDRGEAHASGRHGVHVEGGVYDVPLWLTVSPKPGFKPQMVATADEVKVILGGLGNGDGWPGTGDAIGWAQEKLLGGRERPVYVQPANDVRTLNYGGLHDVLELVGKHPELRVSLQLHKVMGCR